MSAPSGTSAEDRLDSWKEIAAYLGREVRTVQGWEKLEGLPVHRHQHARQGSVYAFKSELEVWRQARRGGPDPPISVEAPTPLEPPPARARRLLMLSVLCLVAILAGATLFLWAKRRPTVTGDIPSSMVVLPFLDLSPQKDQEYFSDGLTEEIIDALTRVPNLRVVARTSAFAFKGQAVDIRRIGQQLNVAAALEGSVRKSGDQLRITAQLARVSDGYHLWSHTYDRSLRDVFAVQREIAQAIADQLQAGDAPPREQPRDLEAWRLYLEGRYFFNKFESPNSERKAIARYQQAIDRDPKFAQAYAGMADAYAYLAENFTTAPKEVMPKAREAAEKAIALNDSSPEAHTSLGIVKLDFDRDRDGGQREFIRAIQLNPGWGYARHWYAHSLEAQGHMDEAMKEMRKALDLDPLSIPINWDVAGELAASGRYPDALRHLDKAAELFPGIPVFPFIRFQIYKDTGALKAARRTLAGMRTSHPEMAGDPMFISVFGVEQVLNGHPAEARKSLARLEQLRADRYVDAFLVLPLCAALKDQQQLALWLKRADEERSSMFVYLPNLKSFYGIDDSLLTR